MPFHAANGLPFKQITLLGMDIYFNEERGGKRHQLAGGSGHGKARCLGAGSRHRPRRGDRAGGPLRVPVPAHRAV